MVAAATALPAAGAAASAAPAACGGEVRCAFSGLPPVLARKGAAGGTCAGGSMRRCLTASRASSIARACFRHPDSQCAYPPVLPPPFLIRIVALFGFRSPVCLPLQDRAKEDGPASADRLVCGLNCPARGP